MQKLRSIVAAVGALVYALSSLRILWSSIPSAWISTRDFDVGVSGSAGLGAVSVGLSEWFVESGFLALASIVVNRLLATWARASDRNVTRLYRVQGWSIVVPFALLVAGVIAFNVRPGPLPFMLFPLSGASWGAQFLLTSALLAVYARRSSRTSTT